MRVKFPLGKIKKTYLVTVVFLVLMNIVQNTNIFETFLQNYEKNIEGFPTIQLEKANGEIIPYEDNREYDSFIVFLNNNLNN